MARQLLWSHFVTVIPLKADTHRSAVPPSMAGRLITLPLKHITQSERIVSGEIFQFFFQPFTDEKQAALHRPHRQP